MVTPIALLLVTVAAIIVGAYALLVALKEDKVDAPSSAPSNELTDIVMAKLEFAREHSAAAKFTQLQFIESCIQELERRELRSLDRNVYGPKVCTIIASLPPEQVRECLLP